MSGVSIIKLIDSHAPSGTGEELAPWLVALDSNQDGAIQKIEVRDPKGLLRCDGKTSRLGLKRWQSLETTLLDAGLIHSRRKKTCQLPVKPHSPEPIPPQRRRPAPYEILFFAQTFDLVFTLQPKITIKKLLKFLKSNVDKIVTGKERIEITLNSGRIVELELDKRGGLQKIHYFDAKGDYTLTGRLEFLQIFRDAGVFKKFFKKNPYYQEEKVVWRRLYSWFFSAVEVPTVSLKTVLKKGWKGILLFPDRHGSPVRFKNLYRLLSRETLDWFALEMLPHELQPSVDTFLSAPEKSSKFKKAKRKLQNYFSAFWDFYFKVKDPDHSPYYRLLLLCRKRKIRVIALDTVASYTTASQKTAPLSIGTRNRVWAEHIPDEGRGVVFGGEFHFTKNRKARVQDFLLDKNPNRTIHLVSY